MWVNWFFYYNVVGYYNYVDVNKIWDGIDVCIIVSIYFFEKRKYCFLICYRLCCEIF